MLTQKLQDSAEGTDYAFRSDLGQLFAEWIGERPGGQQEVVLGAFVVVQVRSTEALNAQLIVAMARKETI